uniref:Zmp:0000001267 n=1 Tax=Xiphophorus couchianus TaxID=32473 RepID=A0A3B5MD25_9TELE
MMEEKQQKLSLKREVGLVGAVSLIAGTMIGSGIFMSPQTVISSIGSSGASLVLWASCGLLVILVSFCYAELGTVIQESGGEYIYILRTSGPVMAFTLAFSSILFVRPAGVAGISLSFAQYVVAPFYPECPPPVFVVKCVAAVAILVLAIVNCMNVRFSMSVQVFFMVAKVVALGIIVVGGVVMLAKGNAESFQNSFENSNVGIHPIGIAFYQGLWSYDGWNNLNYVTEELKRPEVRIRLIRFVNLPRALVIAISLVTGLYLLVNVSYLTVMTPNELMSSTAVAVTWGNISPSGTRCWEAGSALWLPGRVTWYLLSISLKHKHLFTIKVTFRVSSTTSAWFFYAVTLSGLIYLKIKKPELPRPYSVPIVLPILILLVAIFLVLAPIIDQPQIEYLYVALFILSGAIVYVPFIHFKLCPGMFDKVTTFLQLFLEVAPAEKNL